MARTRTLITQSGQGSALSESVLQAHYDALRVGASYVVEGYEVIDSGGLFVDVNSGGAFVNGFAINQTTNQTNQAVAASDVNYCFVNPDGTLEIEVTGTPTDANALKLAEVTTDGSSVTAITNQLDITNGYNVLIRKPSSQSISSPADDTALTFAVNAREIWEVKLILEIGAGSGGATSYGLKIPSGSSTYCLVGTGDDGIGGTKATGGAKRNAYAHTSTSGAANVTMLNNAAQTIGTFFTSGVVHIGATGGSITATWSGAAGGSIHAGSTLIARRILG